MPYIAISTSTAMTEEQKDAFKAVWQPVVDQYITDTWKNTVAEFKANYKG